MYTIWSYPRKVVFMLPNFNLNWIHMIIVDYHFLIFWKLAQVKFEILYIKLFKIIDEIGDRIDSMKDLISS